VGKELQNKEPKRKMSFRYKSVESSESCFEISLGGLYFFGVPNSSKNKESQSNNYVETNEEYGGIKESRQNVVNPRNSREMVDICLIKNANN
jgi:hypothetical protein